LTKRKPSSYMSSEKEKSQRKKNRHDQRHLFFIYIYVGSNQNKSYKKLPNAMKR
jgi:hypothetical protein